MGESGTPPSLHRYLYAYSNPTVYIDLYGYDNFNVAETLVKSALPSTGVANGYYEPLRIVVDNTNKTGVISKLAPVASGALKIVSPIAKVSAVYTGLKRMKAEYVALGALRSGKITYEQFKKGEWSTEPREGLTVEAKGGFVHEGEVVIFTTDGVQLNTGEKIHEGAAADYVTKKNRKSSGESTGGNLGFDLSGKPNSNNGQTRDAKGKLRNSDGTFAYDGGPKQKPTNGNHGNTAGDQPATLYERYDADDNFLKHGISQDPKKRYTQDELDGGYLIETETGPRKEILKTERDLVETNPGPLNKEPWAGSKKGQ